METITQKNQRIKKQDIRIKSLVAFFNNFVESNFKNFSLSIKQNDLKYLIYFLELNVKLLSMNKIQYLFSIDLALIASESDDEFKLNLLKFLIFLIFLINIHNKSFNCLSNLNKYDNIQAYVSLTRKFYIENLIDSESFIKFLKIIASLSLLSFDTDNIWNNTNTQYLNNLYKNSTSLNKTNSNSKAGKNEEGNEKFFTNCLSKANLDVSNKNAVINSQNKKMSNTCFTKLKENDSQMFSGKEDKMRAIEDSSSNRNHKLDSDDFILNKVSVYKSTNLMDFKNEILNSNENNLKKENSLKEEKLMSNKIEIDQIFRKEQFESETKISKKDIDINKTNKNSLKNGKTIKDFNLFWIAISAVTSFHKEEKVLNKDKIELNHIFDDVLNFYTNYIFKNRFNLMKLSLMNNEPTPIFKIFDMLKIKHLNDSNKRKIYELISQIFSNNYSLNVHQKIIDISKLNLIEITHVNNVINLKFPDQDFESQFSLLRLIKSSQEKNNLLADSMVKKKGNVSGILTSANLNVNMNTDEKYKMFNSINNYFNFDNELNIQRISTLNININEKTESSSNIKEAEDPEFQQHKFKNMEIDLNKILELEKENSVNNKIDSEIKTLNEDEFKLNNHKINDKIALDNKREIIKEESPKTENNFNTKSLESITDFQELKENIIQSTINMQSMIELLDYMMTFKEKTQQEIINKINPNDINSGSHFQHSSESDYFSFNKGFIFQNYINNGIVLDPINNFPKKGYSILFSFKWEPLSETSIENKCDLFYFLETKANKIEKDFKEKTENIINNADKIHNNGFDFSMNSDEFHKNIKLGCYILNRKIFLYDANKSYKTGIEVIPGVSYVILIDQKESCGFVRKISKLSITVNNQQTFILEEFLYPTGSMKLLIGSDGMTKPELKSYEVYFLQIGTFIVFNEIFNQEITDNIFGLKGQYDLTLFRNYEFCFPISNEKKQILNNLRKFTKCKIEQGVTVLISESSTLQNSIMKKNQTNKFKENYAEFTNNNKFGELIDRKFYLFNNVIIFNKLTVGEEFLKFDGRSVLLLVFIYLQQINDNFLDEKLCENIFNLIEKLLRLIMNFFKEETCESYLTEMEILFDYLKKFLDKISQIRVLSESLIMALVDCISILNLFSPNSEIYLNFRNKICFIMLNEDFYKKNNLHIQVLVINKLCCCFENYPKGLSSANIFKRFLNFVTKFLLFNKEYQEEEKLELFKILIKKLFLLFYEMLNIFIVEKEKYSMILLIKFLFEESREIRLIYKMIKLIYVFEKRDELISFMNSIPEFKILDNLLLLITKIETNKNKFSNILNATYVDYYDLTQAICLKIIDEFYLRNSLPDKATFENKLKSSKTLTKFELKTAAEADFSQNKNVYMKKILSKNPAFMINFFNVHTIKYLFISIFEKIDFSINTKKENKSSSNEKKYFEDDLNKLFNDLYGKAKNFFNMSFKILKDKDTDDYNLNSLSKIKSYDIISKKDKFEKINALSAKNIILYLKNKADINPKYLMENYKINYEYLKLFLRISVYLNERFSMNTTKIIYYLTIWCYKNIIKNDRKNSISIIESTKYSCDFFYSLINSKFIKQNENQFIQIILKDFTWIINNTISQSSNPFYFQLTYLLIRMKIKMIDFYPQTIKTINLNLLKPAKDIQEKSIYCNVINYLIMIYNIVSLTKPRSKFIEKIQILSQIREFINFILEDPMIFSQKAYKYTYSQSNNDKYDYKILLEILFDVLFDIDINCFIELFFYKNAKSKNTSNEFDTELINITKENALELNLNEQSLSIFFYMDLQYFYCAKEKLDDNHKKIFNKIEANKQTEKKFDTKDSIKFLYPSYTQYFLSKFVAIYIILKKELRSKTNDSTRLDNNPNKNLNSEIDYLSFKINILEKLINVLIRDMKKIIVEYECLLNLRTLHTDRNKITKNYKTTNKIENDFCFKNDLIFSKIKILIKDDDQINCQKLVEQIDKLSSEKKLNYEIYYEKFKIKKRKKKSLFNHENDLIRNNTENHNSKLSSFISSFSSINNEENHKNENNPRNNGNIILNLNSNYSSDKNLKEIHSESYKNNIKITEENEFKKFMSDEQIEHFKSLNQSENKSNINNQNETLLLHNENLNINENLNDFNPNFLNIFHSSKENIVLNNRNLQSCYDLRLIKNNNNLLDSNIILNSTIINNQNKIDKNKFLSSYNINSEKLRNNLNFSMVDFRNNPLVLKDPEEINTSENILNKFFNGSTADINKDYKKFVFFNYDLVKSKLKKSSKEKIFHSFDCYLPPRPNKNIILSNLGIFFKDSYFENKVFLDKIKKIYDSKIFPSNNCRNNLNQLVEFNSEDHSLKVINPENKDQAVNIDEICKRRLSSEFKFRYPIKIKNLTNENYSKVFVKPNLKFLTPKNKFLKISNNYIEDNIIEVKNNIIRLKEYYREMLDLIKLKNFKKKIQVEYITLKGVLKGFLFYSENKKSIMFVDEKTINTLILNEKEFRINDYFGKLIDKLKDNDNMPNRSEFLFTSLKTDFINKFKIIVINFCDIREVLKRRFLFNYQASEIFLKNGKSYYFNFYRDFYVNEFHKYMKIQQETLGNDFYTYRLIDDPIKHFKNSDFTKKWLNGDLSNFDYLSLINKFGGRNFQDQNQYPVFPWIIKDYINNIEDSNVLTKLGKQNIFRNLNNHVSVQTKEKQEYIINKYLEEKTKPFKNHYGVHYSTSAILFYYIIRLSPITEDSIKFQNMHFDHPNRIFTSLKETWDILDRLYDNRELVPEMFSMPELFLNANCYFMGKNSSNFKLVDDINLPEYASNNPIYMVYINRFYLEDKTISDNLTYWIDNIFGENQLKKNKDSLNVFKKCCYAQETNLLDKYEYHKKNFVNDNDKRENDYAEAKILKKIDKILNFGQVPAKLFDSKHPKKICGTAKLNDYETVFNDSFAEIRNLKKPIRYINKSKSFTYVLYFDNEVEVFKSNKFEKSYKFQMKTPAGLTTYNYNFSYIKKKLQEETDIYQRDKEINLNLISKKNNEIDKLNKKIRDNTNNDIKENYRREIEIRMKELKYFENKRERFNENEFIAVNYYFYYYYNLKDKILSNTPNMRSNKISQLISEDLLELIKLNEKSKSKSQNDIYEKTYNDKIHISVYKEKYFINEFCDCKFFIACQYLDNSIKVYKEETKVIEFLLEDFVSCIYKSQDETKLLTGLINGKIIIWEVSTDLKKMEFKIKFIKEFLAHSEAVTSIVINEKWNIIITGGEDGFVYIRNFYDLKIITVIKPEFRVNSINVNMKIVDLYISDFDFLYVNCYFQDEIYLFGYNLNGLSFGYMKCAVNHLEFSPTGKLIISEYFSKEMAVYHPITFKLLFKENDNIREENKFTGSNINLSSKRKNKSESNEFPNTSFFIEKIKENYFLTKSSLEGLVKIEQINNSLFFGGE